MTQKDNVKQLIGKSLNAYNDKVLQQIDKIEKKNKQQNHKISMLTNELDNDYLTKSEEGSVISLEHSKEGMVYIDNLEGNTLVNYCTDGAKELTLNGDIDLEGTFVTTTEGVDGGKVDVMCEGNTLIVDADGNEVDAGTEGATLMSVGQDDENGHKIEILSNNKNLIHTVRNYNNTLDRGVTMTMENNNTLHLNGTTTNANGDLDYTLHNSEQMDVYLKPNRNYIVNFEVISGSVSPIPSNAIKITDLVTEKVEWRTVKDSNRVISSSSNPRTVSWIRLAYSNITTFNNYKYRVQIEEGNVVTPYTKGLLNKKEILLNEPLRGLPNGVKDRFVKIGGKWYIERNCAKAIIDGTSQGRTNTSYLKENEFIMFTKVSDHPIKINGANLISATYKTYNKWSEMYNDTSGEGISNVDNTLGIGIRISNSKTGITSSDTNAQISEKLLEYFQANPFEVIYEPKTPTYEEIIDVELITYLDTTHISNNSIIPCNMKVKNSGYNVIIKPSTLYTVALDTNKSGTIGLNLGGAKETTSNNVLTLTTPTTLTDDSLRIYGKGIKGSKVRLLEGDKTNWIPSFFEGMKSSFEDKVQEDGTYKMEILSNNKNLWVVNNKTAQKDNLTVEFDHDTQIITVNGVCNIEDFYIYQGREYIIKDIPKNELNYTLSYEIVSGSYDITNSVRNSFGYIGISSREFGTTINIGGLNMISRNSVSFKMKNQPNNTWFRLDKGTVFNNLKLKISLEPYIRKTDYVKPSFNKIQFSSIEPLRGVGDIKDRFVFKDGKLVIERNTKEILLNGSEDWRYREVRSDCYCYTLNISDLKKYGINSCKQGYVDRFFMRHLLPFGAFFEYLNGRDICLQLPLALGNSNVNAIKDWLNVNNTRVVYELEQPTYEEIPFELQKIILEGYENGTLFIYTNIPPTSTVTYAGETPIVKVTKLNKTEVLNNTTDINDNIIPYLMDMDYRVVCLELATETQGISMARLFGGTFEMLQRDILSKRYSVEEYKYRLDAYLSVNKITEKEYEELGEMLNE